MARSALIVASWMYEDPLLRRLVAPAQDAESLSAVLRNPDIGNFDVTVLANEPSYRVCEQVEAFFSDREHDDLLVLYFSGHGVTDSDGLLYYAASNTLHKRLRSTGVGGGENELAATFVKSAAGHAVRCSSSTVVTAARSPVPKLLHLPT